MLALALAWAGAAAAGSLAEGAAAYDRGDYREALRIWLPLAEAGDVAAMRNVAQLYRRGLGVEADGRKAANWYRRAAGRGLVRAQANLGQMYLTGDGVDRDPAEAARWFERAALGGHIYAMYQIGRMYDLGEGVPVDAWDAWDWLQRAAALGSTEAKAYLRDRGKAREPSAAGDEESPAAGIGDPPEDMDQKVRSLPWPDRR